MWCQHTALCCITSSLTALKLETEETHCCSCERIIFFPPHSFFVLDFSRPTFWGHILLFIMLQMFSESERSELQAGQRSARTLSLQSRVVVMLAEGDSALSCWNKQNPEKDVIWMSAYATLLQILYIPLSVTGAFADVLPVHHAPPYYRRFMITSRMVPLLFSLEDVVSIIFMKFFFSSVHLKWAWTFLDLVYMFFFFLAWQSFNLWMQWHPLEDYCQSVSVFGLISCIQRLLLTILCSIL